MYVLHVQVYVWVISSISSLMSVHVHVHVSTCTCMYYMYMYTCMYYMYMYMYMYEWYDQFHLLFHHVCTCTCMYIYMYVHVRLYTVNKDICMFMIVVWSHTGNCVINQVHKDYAYYMQETRAFDKIITYKRP